MKILYTIFIVILLNHIGLANEDKTIFINRDLRCIAVTENIITLEKNKNYIVQQIILKNIENTTEELMLELPTQEFEKIQFTQYKKNVVKQEYNYTSKKLSRRIYYDRNIVFPITLESYQISTILLKIYNNTDTNTKALLWKKDAKIVRTEALELTRGIFYGILILFALIIFIVSILIREKNYFYYLLYISSGIIYLFIKNNLGNELLWPDYPSVDLFLKKIMLSVYLISSLIFLKGFLNKRFHLPTLQKALRYFIYLSIIQIGISLSIGFLSKDAQRLFISIQEVYTAISLTSIVLTFIFAYFKTKEKSLVIFTLLYFLSFSFFLFYPQPEFGEDIMGVYIGQLYTYSNAFIMATIICFITVYGILQIIKNNERTKKEMSIANANNTFALIYGQQNERMRVGRELHDGIGIMMSAVKMKTSAIKAKSVEEQNKINDINKEIDKICSSIRHYSHQLLPPTLKKFGLKIALKDLFETFTNTSKTNTKFNINIPDNLTPVSQQLIYEITKNIIDYFITHSPEYLQMSIYIFPSIKETKIKIQYKGASINIKNEYLQSVSTTINLLHGNFEVSLINAWNYVIQIEFPVLLEDIIEDKSNSTPG